MWNFCVNLFELHIEIRVQAHFCSQISKKGVYYSLVKFFRMLFEKSLEEFSMNWDFIAFLIGDIKNNQYRHMKKKPPGFRKKKEWNLKKVESWFSITRQIRSQWGQISNEAIVPSNKKKGDFLDTYVSSALTSHLYSTLHENALCNMTWV